MVLYKHAVSYTVIFQKETFPLHAQLQQRSLSSD